MVEEKRKLDVETVDDKFIKHLRNKHNTKERDKVEIPKETMEGILKDIVQVPEMLRMTGTPERNSAKKIKSGENPLLTGDGEHKHKSTMNKEY